MAKKLTSNLRLLFLMTIISISIFGLTIMVIPQFVEPDIIIETETKKDIVYVDRDSVQAMDLVGIKFGSLNELTYELNWTQNQTANLSSYQFLHDYEHNQNVFTEMTVSNGRPICSSFWSNSSIQITNIQIYGFGSGTLFVYIYSATETNGRLVPHSRQNIINYTLAGSWENINLTVNHTFYNNLTQNNVWFIGLDCDTGFVWDSFIRRPGQENHSLVYQQTDAVTITEFWHLNNLFPSFNLTFNLLEDYVNNTLTTTDYVKVMDQDTPILVGHSDQFVYMNLFDAELSEIFITMQAEGTLISFTIEALELANNEAYFIELTLVFLTVFHTENFISFNSSGYIEYKINDEPYNSTTIVSFDRI